MNLIDRVKELQKLEVNATPGAYEVIERINEWEIYRPCLPIASVTQEKNAKLLVALRNVAPDLLSIMGEIRPGDSDILQLFVEFMEKHRPDGHLNDTGKGTEITNASATDCLRRYQAMAARMEAEE